MNIQKVIIRGGFPTRGHWGGTFTTTAQPLHPHRRTRVPFFFFLNLCNNTAISDANANKQQGNCWPSHLEKQAGRRRPGDGVESICTCVVATSELNFSTLKIFT